MNITFEGNGVRMTARCHWKALEMNFLNIYYVCERYTQSEQEKYKQNKAASDFSLYLNYIVQQ